MSGDDRALTFGELVGELTVDAPMEASGLSAIVGRVEQLVGKEEPLEGSARQGSEGVWGQATRPVAWVCVFVLCLMFWAAVAWGALELM